MSKNSLSSTFMFLMCSKHSALQSRFFWGQGRNITQIFKVKFIFSLHLCWDVHQLFCYHTSLCVSQSQNSACKLKSPSALGVWSLSKRSVLMCVWLLGWRSLTIRGSRSRMLTPPPRTPLVANPRGLVQSAWKKKEITKLKKSNHIFVRLNGDKLLEKRKPQNY